MLYIERLGDFAKGDVFPLGRVKTIGGENVWPTRTRRRISLPIVEAIR